MSLPRNLRDLYRKVTIMNLRTVPRPAPVPGRHIGNEYPGTHRRLHRCDVPPGSRDSTAEDIPRRIDVAVFDKTTNFATIFTHAQGHGLYLPTRRARHACALRVHPYKLATGSLGLVGERVDEPTPLLFMDGAGELAVPHHVLDLQVFHGNPVVLPGDCRGQAVQCVTFGNLHARMGFRQRAALFRPVPRSPAGAGQKLLRSPDTAAVDADAWVGFVGRQRAPCLDSHINPDRRQLRSAFGVRQFHHQMNRRADRGPDDAGLPDLPGRERRKPDIANALHRQRYAACLCTE